MLRAWLHHPVMPNHARGNLGLICTRTEATLDVFDADLAMCRGTLMCIGSSVCATSFALHTAIYATMPDHTRSSLKDNLKLIAHASRRLFVRSVM